MTAVEPERRVVPISPEGRAILEQDAAKAQEFALAATDFREFIKHWHFRSDVLGEVVCMGDVLWESQEMFIQAAKSASWVFFLKARKLGETTIECAWDAWVLRFRDANARVHLFSRRDDAAQELLAMVKLGLSKLPDYMQLPIVKNTTHELELNAGADDRRLVKAYPANEETAVESTCTHGHVDEWARMKNPRKVWQAIEPSMAGTCHIVTTGLGPVNFSAEFWRRAEAGLNPFLPFFVDSLRRPDRNPEWLEAKRQSYPRESDARQEYPMTPEDALSGDGSYFFEDKEIDRATEEPLGPTKPIAGHVYVKAWDIGRHADAAVGTVIDVTEALMDVVWYERRLGLPYPMLQRLIDDVHVAYPGPTVIESNSAGEAVAENLEMHADDCVLFATTGKSKPKALGMLKHCFQRELLKFDALVWPQIETEVRGYKLPDDDIVQDTVMSLAIGVASASTARGGRWKKKRGRVLKPILA